MVSSPHLVNQSGLSKFLLYSSCKETLHKDTLNPSPQGFSSVCLKQTHYSFDEVPERDVVSWTASISRFCRNGQLYLASQAFKKMRDSKIEPNHITFIILLSACANFPSKTLYFGSSLHGYLCKLGWQENNIALGTAIVNMYAKGGRIRSARQAFDCMKSKNSFSWNSMINGYMISGDPNSALSMFDEMPERDKVSWTALMGGLIKNGYYEEALSLFREMQISNVGVDYVTVISFLTACANLGALGHGIWMHSYALKKNLCENLRVANSLIDMYSRCGCIDLSLQVFDQITTRSLVSWNSIINGFAINGYAKVSLVYFFQMQKEGFRPDEISFTGALTACSHAGMVEKGFQLYHMMRKMYHIFPRIEHFGCLVDLLSRAGHLEDAFRVIKSMPMKPNEVILGSLLAACRIHGDINLAEELIGYLIDLEPETDSNYVLLSNIYAAAGRWDDVGMARNIMKTLGIVKMPGYSAVEIDGKIHEFVACDRSHMSSNDILSMLNHLSLDMKLHGYVPETLPRSLTEYG